MVVAPTLEASILDGILVMFLLNVLRVVHRTLANDYLGS